MPRTGALLRKAIARRGGAQPELVAHQAEQVFRVAAVDDGEGLVEPDLRGIVTQQARTDAVEGARPGAEQAAAGWK